MLIAICMRPQLLPASHPSYTSGCKLLRICMPLPSLLFVSGTAATASLLLLPVAIDLAALYYSDAATSHLKAVNCAALVCCISLPRLVLHPTCRSGLYHNRY